MPFVDGSPVSFCYVTSTTERLWDVSLDTLAGYCERCCGCSVCALPDRTYAREGQTAGVWCAVESNLPSMDLAAKLGFVPVDRIFVFEPAWSR